ncbi:MAG: bifunctional [glutamine synthetase] adenylyltransferase/[glutamine synthetase]-adenylyl-L-tyrosine phosphorylase, partial [Hyphomicrobium sp.]
MAIEAGITGPLGARIIEAPASLPDERVATALAQLREQASAAPVLAPLGKLLDEPRVGDLIGGILAGSAYLGGLIERDPARLQRILTRAPEIRLAELSAELTAELQATLDRPAAMRALRALKTEVALLTALADLGGVWPAMTVAAALSECADAALTGAVDFLFREAAARGQWTAQGDGRVSSAGYIVLAMGKFGAGELNYSSDVDLIVFYDPDRIALAPEQEPAKFFVRLTRDLVQLLEERTGDGYVFRTDLRLRPDPGATQ